MEFLSFCHRQINKALKGLLTCLIVVLLLLQESSPQSCLPEGILFTTQSQIDSFPINYPNCTEIEGFVHIWTEEISNLNGLSVITSIDSNLVITETNLIDLAGLENLTHLGGDLSLYYNDYINDLSGINNLSSVNGSLRIVINSLSSLNGLNNLTDVEGFVKVQGNGVQNLIGLDSLTTIGGAFYIEGNNSLINLIGVENLSTIGGNLVVVGNNSLLNFEGISNLSTIGNRLYYNTPQ